MKIYAWKVFPLLISGIWLMNSYILLQFNPQHGATCCVINCVRNIPKKERRNSLTRSEDVGWTSVDYVTSNAKPSRFDALLYLFDDKEAVIKMIIKGRSPTMRHASRTHRVALDPKNPNQICRNQEPTRRHLTKGSFTRDEWNHLLCLLNIMNNSMFFLQPYEPHYRSLKPCRRGRHGKENRVEKMSAWMRNEDVRKNPVSMTHNPSSFSQSSGDLTANCSTPDSLSAGKLSAVDSDKNNIRLSSVAHRY